MLPGIIPMPFMKTQAAVYQGPGDIVTTGWKFWGGLRAFTNAKIGTKCCNIWDVTSSTQADFNTVAGGLIDVAAVASFLGSHTGAIVALYDQSGNGNDFAPTGVSTAPVYTVNVIGSKPAMANTSAPAAALLKTIAAALTAPYTYIGVGSRTSNFTTVQVFLSDAGGNQLSWNSVANQIRCTGGSGNAIATAADSTFHHLLAVLSAGTGGIVVDGGTYTTATGTAGTSNTVLALGAYAGGGFNVDGYMLEAGVNTADLNASAAVLSSNSQAFWGY